MPGDLEQKIERATRMSSLSDRYERARARYDESLQKSIDRRNQRRLQAERAAQEAALEQQKIDAQLARDKRQQQYAQASTAQRAMFEADAANTANKARMQAEAQQNAAMAKRQASQNAFDKSQTKADALNQAFRDRRQFDFAQRENAQQFENQLQRDAVQQGYTQQRDATQQGYTNARDYMQFGYDTLRGDQQQRELLEREQMQQMLQLQRDAVLNEYATQQDSRQQQNLLEREKQQQTFTRQNMYQREAADISAKWQEQVATAKNAGLDFSEAQRREMQSLEKTFRQKVLAGPYSESVKQQAMVEHQKKLAQIIPEERVQDPVSVMNSSIMFHEPTGTWMQKTADSRGMPSFEPLSMTRRDSMQQDGNKQQDIKREAEFQREEEFQAVVDKLEAKLNPETREPFYQNQEQLMADAMKQFSRREQLYQSQYGLAPLFPSTTPAAFPATTNKWRAMMQAAPQTPELQKYARQQAQLDRIVPMTQLSQQPQMPQAQTQTPPATKAAEPITATLQTIDDHIARLTKMGDMESVAALNVIKDINNRNNGPPKAESEDMVALAAAMRHLRSKAIDLKPKAAPPTPTETKRTLRWELPLMLP